MHPVIIAPLPTPRGHTVGRPVRPKTTRRINLLTATVQNEIISNNSENLLYMLYRGMW